MKPIFRYFFITGSHHKLKNWAIAGTNHNSTVWSYTAGIANWWNFLIVYALNGGMHYFSLLYQVLHSTNETQQGQTVHYFSVFHMLPLKISPKDNTDGVKQFWLYTAPMYNSPEDLWFNYTTYVANSHPLQLQQSQNGSQF